MKVTGYICCMLGLAYIASATGAIDMQDKIDRQLFDTLETNDSPKDKRPFCNAFTGCGKKRSFHSDNSLDNGNETGEKIQIPVSIYRALLRAANQDIRESLDGATSEENAVPNLFMDYPAYLERRMPNRQRY